MFACFVPSTHRSLISARAAPHMKLFDVTNGKLILTAIHNASTSWQGGIAPSRRASRRSRAPQS